MYSIENYNRPETLMQAYKILSESRSNSIIAGGTFLKLGRRSIKTAVDLSNLKLSYIEKKGEFIEIGAMTSLREIETSVVLKQYYGNFFSDALCHIVGVQFKNSATAGAGVYSRYGFSDILTALYCINAKVVLYRTGEMNIQDFLAGAVRGDILEKIIIPAKKIRASYKSIRYSYCDFAVVNVAVCQTDGVFSITVGARPRRAAKAQIASDFITGNEKTMDNINKTAFMAAEELSFGSNNKASAEYRKTTAQVLIRRAIQEVAICR